MRDADAGEEASPGLDLAASRGRGRLLFTLHLDGEVFAVRGHDYGTDYDWISGPNKGYGFGFSARDMPEEWHRDQIRGFLGMIDPSTGYIEDD